MNTIVLTGPPTAGELADPAKAKAWKAARDFESVALNELLAPMFDTVDSAHGPMGGGDAEAMWRPMLTQQIADEIAQHDGLGLASPIYRQMLQTQEVT